MAHTIFKPFFQLQSFVAVEKHDYYAELGNSLKHRNGNDQQLYFKNHNIYLLQNSCSFFIKLPVQISNINASQLQSIFYIQYKLTCIEAGS